MDKKWSRCKSTTKYHEIVILLCIHILMLIQVVQTTTCTPCTNHELGGASKNITFGPNNDYNCNCQWTIISMDTDKNAAVVLLLQNVSLPITSGSGGSTDCSARIRFPATDGYKCNFPHTYCLVFATESTSCNTNKVNESIPVSNHTCNSITTWSKAGGSQYKILYNAGNFAGYTKYFIIQYMVIDCSQQTTTPIKTTSMTPMPTTSQSIVETHTNYSIGNIKNSTESTPSYRTTTKKAANTTTQKTASDPQPSTGNSTSVIIIVAVGTGLLIILIVVLLILKRYRAKRNSYPRHTLQKNDKSAESNFEKEMVENSLYGATMNEHKSEMIVNEIYDTSPLDENKKNVEIEPDLYAVVRKKVRQPNDNNSEDGENSDVYAVVNKYKK